MNVLPAIERELRAEARHPFTYWLRVIGAASLVAVAALAALEHGLTPQRGGLLFRHLHNLVFFGIWIFVPLVTADCISRERREGTLGLLFLTPLRAGDIVLAKGLVHGLRAAALCLAVLPVVMIPFLMGGVSRADAALAVLTDFSSFCWALGAGLLASSRCKVWLRSLTLAGLLAFVFFLLFCEMAGAAASASLANSAPGFFARDFNQGPVLLVALVSGFLVSTDLGSMRTYLLATIAPGGQAGLVWAAAGVSLASLFILGGVIILAAGNVRRDWQEKAPSAWQLWVRQTFLSPVVLRSFFKKWLRGRLTKNPIGWLEQRTWSARLVTWGWLAVMISYLSAVIGQMQFLLRDFMAAQSPIGFLLAGSMALSAAGSFRRERETGALELILVTPLTVRQIVGGRLRGLWGQFFPAVALFLGAWLYLAHGLSSTNYWNVTWREQLEKAGFFLMTFATLPVVGLYCSLRSRNFLAALLGTLLLGVVLPMALPTLAVTAYRFARGFGIVITAENYAWARWLVLQSPSLIQLLLALLLGRRLCRNLEQRTFALDKPPS